MKTTIAERHHTMFRPGDTIDGISLTTGSADAPPLWAFCSSSQHLHLNKRSWELHPV